MNCELNTYHVPVMLEECLEGLNIKPNGVYVDVTFGGGGHSRAILERLGDGGHLYSFDQDLDAAKNAFEDDRFTFVRSNFRYLKNFLRYHGVEKVDGILADLGVSSHHLDDETRGFSFRFEGKLDMRMNTAAGKTAADVLNEYSEEELANVFYFYGELQQARKLDKAIVKARGEMEFDAQGRVLLPKRLQVRMGLESEVVFVGMVDKIAMWSKSMYEEQFAVKAKLSERLKMLGSK